MKTILFSVLCLVSTLCYGQGNLQFSQVLTYSQNFNLVGCGTNLCSWSGSLYTVPSGKAWKIENFAANGQADIVMTLNSTVNINTNNTFPIWLKSGDIIQVKKLCGSGASCSLQSGSFFISIIEFNIIP
jgi:hypothetical protein